MSRKRRGSLSGWWRYLPFVLVPFVLLFSEVWFQTQILNNEYRKNTLRSNIKRAEARVDALHDEIRELERMERVLQHAPNLGLVPPDPGQIIEILADGDNPLETRVVAATPLLASPLPKPKPAATVTASPPAHEPAAELEELEVLEPEAEWVQ